LYYENDGTCNAYFWDKEDDDFSCCVVVKRDVNEGDSSWNSINLFDVCFDSGEVTYKLMTTVFLELKDNTNGDFMIMGNSTKK